MSEGISRRRFLKTAGIVTGAAVVGMNSLVPVAAEAADAGVANATGAAGAAGGRGAAGRSGVSAYAWQGSQQFDAVKYTGLLIGDVTGRNSSVDWPFVIRVDDKLPKPMGKYYMFFSSDHAGGGISLAYADTPLGPWTLHGRVFRQEGVDEAGKAMTYETETPSVIWDGKAKVFILLWHGFGTYPGEAQTTWRMTSADGITWDSTQKAKALRLDPERLTGNLHNGYMLPFRIGGSWFAYSLMGGQSGGSALHWSEDGGYTWYTDHRKLGRWSINLEGKCFFPHHGTVIFFQGQYWFLESSAISCRAFTKRRPM